jgi:hypothetical protein
VDRLTLAGRDKFNTIFSSVVLVAVISLYRSSIHKNCARRERVRVGVDRGVVEVTTLTD